LEYSTCKARRLAIVSTYLFWPDSAHLPWIASCRSRASMLEYMTFPFSKTVLRIDEWHIQSTYGQCNQVQAGDSAGYSKLTKANPPGGRLSAGRDRQQPSTINLKLLTVILILSISSRPSSFPHPPPCSASLSVHQPLFPPCAHSRQVRALSKHSPSPKSMPVRPLLKSEA
jgi:hypothetical protein